MMNVMTHLHIIPRKAQDRLWTSKSIRRKPLKLNEDTIQLADCIREGLLPPQTNNCDACEDQRSKLAERMFTRLHAVYVGFQFLSAGFTDFKSKPLVCSS
ncbi:hypothetical protein ACLOJK_009074 [Asimina triloba]